MLWLLKIYRRKIIETNGGDSTFSLSYTLAPLNGCSGGKDACFDTCPITFRDNLKIEKNY